jgi:transposase
MSELGLRPIYHWKEQRIDGHLFVSILAYQCIRIVRLLLGEKNITDSWETIVKTLKTRIRETIVVKSDTKPTFLMRKSAIPDELHIRIYKALNLRLNPSKIIKKRLINSNSHISNIPLIFLGDKSLILLHIYFLLLKIG